MTYYVYRIDCKPTGQVYYGSTNDPPGRWQEHIAEQGSKKPLYQALETYGVGQFTMSVIEEHPTRYLATCSETRWIKVAKQAENCLNVAKCTIADRPCSHGGSRDRHKPTGTPLNTTCGKQTAIRDYWRRVREGVVEAPLDWLDGRIVRPEEIK
jgi:group I intron endonuclease